MSFDPKWRERAVAASEVVRHVGSGARLFLHGGCATPGPLVQTLAAREDLEGVELYHLHTSGPAPFADPSAAGRLFSNSLFTGPGLRKAVEEGRADFIPIFLSDIPGLFTSGVVPLDVAVLQLSPPDKHGYCSLGVSVDAARAAADSARIVLAEINERMPRTHGNSSVSFASITAFTLTDRALFEMAPAAQSDVEQRIGAIVADLVEDGATLQMGIGAIPDAVLARLGTKNDLGVHTEMFSDGLISLLRNGNVTNHRKVVHPNRTVTSFVGGTRTVFDFVDDNPTIEFHPCDRTNDTALIRKNPKVTAINSAIEIDLTGQVCADSIGHAIFSGIGGQMDFMRGAALSREGKPIIALPSTAAKGRVSRITSVLKPGAGVVTSRGHVHWVATEFGVVNLHGMTLRERGEALISIAHPDFRAELRKDLADIRHFPQT